MNRQTLNASSINNHRLCFEQKTKREAFKASDWPTKLPDRSACLENKQTRVLRGVVVDHFHLDTRTSHNFNKRGLQVDFVPCWL